METEEPQEDLLATVTHLNDVNEGVYEDCLKKQLLIDEDEKNICKHLIVLTNYIVQNLFYNLINNFVLKKIREKQYEQEDALDQDIKLEIYMSRQENANFKRRYNYYVNKFTSLEMKITNLQNEISSNNTQIQQIEQLLKQHNIVFEPYALSQRVFDKSFNDANDVFNSLDTLNAGNLLVSELSQMGNLPQVASLTATPTPNVTNENLFNSGLTTTTRNIFGAENTPATDASRSTGLFGTTNYTQGTCGNLFGASPSNTSNTGGNLFGANTSNVANTGGNLFDTATGTTQGGQGTSESLFGLRSMGTHLDPSQDRYRSLSQSTFAPTIFTTSPTTNVNASSNTGTLFGMNKTSSNTAGNSLFGTTSASTGLFGGSQSNTNQNLFGDKTNVTNTSAGGNSFLFGGTNTSSLNTTQPGMLGTPSNSLFGNVTTATTNNANNTQQNLFGGTSNMLSNKSGLFSGPSNTSLLFGSPSTGMNSFNDTKINTSSSSNLFGTSFDMQPNFMNIKPENSSLFSVNNKSGLGATGMFGSTSSDMQRRNIFEGTAGLQGSTFGNTGNSMFSSFGRDQNTMQGAMGSTGSLFSQGGGLFGSSGGVGTGGLFGQSYTPNPYGTVEQMKQHYEQMVKKTNALNSELYKLRIEYKKTEYYLKKEKRYHIIKENKLREVKRKSDIHFYDNEMYILIVLVFMYFKLLLKGPFPSNEKNKKINKVMNERYNGVCDFRPTMYLFEQMLGESNKFMNTFFNIIFMDNILHEEHKNGEEAIQKYNKYADYISVYNQKKWVLIKKKVNEKEIIFNTTNITEEEEKLVEEKKKQINLFNCINSEMFYEKKLQHITCSYSKENSNSQIFMKIKFLGFDILKTLFERDILFIHMYSMWKNEKILQEEIAKFQFDIDMDNGKESNHVEGTIEPETTHSNKSKALGTRVSKTNANAFSKKENEKQVTDKDINVGKSSSIPVYIHNFLFKNINVNSKTTYLVLLLKNFYRSNEINKLIIFFILQIFVRDAKTTINILRRDNDTFNFFKAALRNIFIYNLNEQKFNNCYIISNRTIKMQNVLNQFIDMPLLYLLTSYTRQKSIHKTEYLKKPGQIEKETEGIQNEEVLNAQSWVSFMKQQQGENEEVNSRDDNKGGAFVTDEIHKDKYKMEKRMGSSKREKRMNRLEETDEDADDDNYFYEDDEDEDEDEELTETAFDEEEEEAKLDEEHDDYAKEAEIGEEEEEEDEEKDIHSYDREMEEEEEEEEEDEKNFCYNVSRRKQKRINQTEILKKNCFI